MKTVSHSGREAMSCKSTVHYSRPQLSTIRAGSALSRVYFSFRFLGQFIKLFPSALLISCLLSLWLAPTGMAQTATAANADKVRLAIELSQPGAKIERNIFGQFAEHLGHGVYEGIWVGPDSSIPNTRGMRNDVIAALKALKVPNVRWPGGCFADEYHWRKGIGPQRVVTLNPIGAEAYLSLHLGSGTPQEAAEWLEYLTTNQPTALGKERAANGHPPP